MLNVFNSILSAFTYSYVVHQYHPLKTWRRKIWYWGLLFIGEYLCFHLLGFPAFVNYCVQAMVTLFCIEDKSLTVSMKLLYGVSANTVIYTIVLLAGSVIHLLVPQERIATNFVFYNVLMNGIVILVIIVASQLKWTFKVYTLEQTQPIVWLKFAGMVAFLYVFSGVLLAIPAWKQLPEYRDSIPSTYALTIERSYHQIVGLCLLFIALTYLAYQFINHLAYDNYNKKLELQFLRGKISVLDEMDKKITEIDHYYSGLYQDILPYILDEDMEALRVYFDAEITPIHEKLLRERSKEIEVIHYQPLKRLLLSTANAAAHYKIRFLFQAEAPVHAVNMDDLSFYKLARIYINNALEETKDQKDGYIMIGVGQNLKTLDFSMIIQNSVAEKKQKSGSRGQGRKIAEAIAKANSQVYISTAVEFNKYIQVIEVKGEKS